VSLRMGPNPRRQVSRYRTQTEAEQKRVLLLVYYTTQNRHVQALRMGA
jgi:hypothetical protein